MSSGPEAHLIGDDYEKEVLRKKKIITYTITGLLIFSVLLIAISLAIPQIQLRRHVNDLRSGGAHVITVHKTPEWLESITGKEFPILEQVTGINFGRSAVTDRTLQSVSHWHSLEFIGLIRADISEDSISNLLSGCSEMNQLQVVSCPKISPSFIQEMRSKYPMLQINYRGVAYLGIAGQNHSQGCQIYYLDSGMPAQLAGVKTGDVLTSFNEQQVKSFEHLVHLIGEHQPDDEITLKLIRKGQELSLPCKLTGWKGDLR
ncbi:MAG: PDZ domain-containing protein [Planctomycetaceae bacterium]|nr:PDZ domain-containing protein [Planctomycetaceae bacterium]